jgi:hypothetical protein
MNVRLQRGHKKRFHGSTRESQNHSQSEKLADSILGSNEETQSPDDERVEGDVGPGSNRVHGRVLPCLQALSIEVIVCGLPVVECLITVYLVIYSKFFMNFNSGVY